MGTIEWHQKKVSLSWCESKTKIWTPFIRTCASKRKVRIGHGTYFIQTKRIVSHAITVRMVAKSDAYGRWLFQMAAAKTMSWVTGWRSAQMPMDDDCFRCQPHRDPQLARASYISVTNCYIYVWHNYNWWPSATTTSELRHTGENDFSTCHPNITRMHLPLRHIYLLATQTSIATFLLYTNENAHTSKPCNCLIYISVTDISIDVIVVQHLHLGHTYMYAI